MTLLVTTDAAWLTTDAAYATTDGSAERPPLLPSNATALERVLAAIDGRLDDVDTDLIRRVKSVGDAPAGLLPYLAWERSVDVWDPAWPEATKRAVIAAAPVVHRYKGTRYAVAQALAAFDVDATITEWWQASPARLPYTFHVRAYARADLYGGEFVLDARLIRAARAAIMAAKPLSRAFTFSIGATFARPLRLLAAASARTRRRVAAHGRFSLLGEARLGLAAVGAARLRCRAPAITVTA